MRTAARKETTGLGTVIRWGSLGRSPRRSTRSGGGFGGATGSTAPGSWASPASSSPASSSPASSSPASSSSGRTGRGGAELAGWDLRHGRVWSRALESLAHRTAEAGIPVRAGSAGLLGSPALSMWGWCGPVDPCWTAKDAAPRWVLRVPPGHGEQVRAWLEEDLAALDVSGAPSILVEESFAAFLPVAPALPAGPSRRAWPSADAWMHAERLFSVAASPAAGFISPGFVPRNAQALLTGLREGDAASGRRPVAEDRAALLAWDLWCAAWAWDRDPAAWWLASRPAAGSAARVRAAWKHAADRGVRILAPCPNRSMLCARPESGAVRLGLDELGPEVSTHAPVLLRERAQGGFFRSREGLVSRTRRAGVSWRALFALLVSGAAEALPWRTEPVAGVKRPFIVSFPGTGRRAVCRLSCLTP